MTYPNPDGAENRALQAALAINEHAGKLWLAAFADGVREGIASAAACLDVVAKGISDDYSLDADLRVAALFICEQLRDQFRLSALSVPDPGTATGEAR